MPRRLRPTTAIASDAILVGDPGRALLLAQDLLTRPKMSNHARGLWGYSGRTADGLGLTIQATGMGGPSAALVTADLAELGVERAVRVGTCFAFDAAARGGELLAVEAALAVGGSSASFGVATGETVAPDPELHRLLAAALGAAARNAVVASLDTVAARPEAAAGAAAADMQTLAVLATALDLRLRAAAVLVASETEHEEEPLEGERLEEASRQAGRAAALALSNLQVEG